MTLLDEINIEKHLAEEEKYRLLTSQLKSLLTKNDNWISNLSNCNAAKKEIYNKIQHNSHALVHNLRYNFIFFNYFHFNFYYKFSLSILEYYYIL